MRTIDRLTTHDHQIPSVQLMQNAAQACFLEIKKFFSGNLNGKRALVLCGLGNNGGDGAALAPKLALEAVDTHIVLFGRLEDSRGDSRTSLETAKTLVADAKIEGHLRLSEDTDSSQWNLLAEQLRDFDVIVDALFGTGLTRPLEGIFATVVEDLAKLNSLRTSSTNRPLIVSVDLPSGLNSDSSQTFGPSVHADLTVTFTSPKAANVLPPASHLNGRLVIADIGSPASLVESQASSLFLVEEQDVRGWLQDTRYAPESFKNTHGHVLLIAGSIGYTGAAVLSGNAAIRAGAGLVTIATPASVQSVVATAAMPEIITASLAETDRGAISDVAIEHVKTLTAASVVAIGPGLSADDERTRRFVDGVVRQRTTPMVIDADALNCLAPWPTDLMGSAILPLVLTPHPGEMLRLLGADEKSKLDDRVATAREFATKHQVILVLKGSRTIIAAGGRVFINPTGNAGLGTAGSGDTLTGTIAGFIAQAVGTLKDRADILRATIAAVFISGRAGDLAARDLGMRHMVASDIREYLGEAICSVDSDGETPLSA